MAVISDSDRVVRIVFLRLIEEGGLESESSPHLVYIV